MPCSEEAAGGEVKEEAADPVKMETEEEEDVKVEAAGEDESWDHKRGHKRAGSPIKGEEDGGEAQESSPKKSKQDAEICLVSRDEDPFDKSLVVLDWCKLWCGVLGVGWRLV